MKAAPFEYARPASLAEACGLLASHGPDAKLIAGGQSLVPMMAMRLARPAWLIDIGRLTELQRLTLSANVVAGEDGVLAVGAGVSPLRVGVCGASVRPSASPDPQVHACSPSSAWLRGALMTTSVVASAAPPSTCTYVAATVDTSLVAVKVTVTASLCQASSTPCATVTGSGPSRMMAPGDADPAP